MKSKKFPSKRHPAHQTNAVHRVQAEKVFRGRVKWFNAAKGYGFIEIEDPVKDGAESEVFVHASSITGTGFRALAEGEKVQFELSDERGRQATKVVALQ